MADSDDDNNYTTLNKIAFVSIVKKYPIIFDKSQMPDIKTKKALAYAEIQQQYKTELHINLTVQKLMKKLHNLKTRIKNKMVLKNKSSRKIKLKSWEEEILQLMVQGDAAREEFVQATRALEEETSFAAVQETVEDEDPFVEDFPEPEDSKAWFEHFKNYASSVVVAGPSNITDSSGTTMKQELSQNEIPSQTDAGNRSTEPEEVRNLSTNDLQRLVFIEQLQVLRLIKQQLLSKQI